MRAPRPEALDPGVRAEYLAERSALKSIMPRARVSQDADGTLIVTAKAARHAPNHLYVQGPGRLVGLFYSGSPHVYLHRLAGLVERHQAGDGEGILHLRWCPDLAEALPWFSRRGGHRGGRLFATDQGATLAAPDARGASSPPPAPPEAA